MRCDAKTEQKRFWKIFDEKLVENGEPFSIVHEKSGMVTYWAREKEKINGYRGNELDGDCCFIYEYKLEQTNIAIFNKVVKPNEPDFSCLKYFDNDFSGLARPNCSDYNEYIDKALRKYFLQNLDKNDRFCYEVVSLFLSKQAESNGNIEEVEEWFEIHNSQEFKKSIEQDVFSLIHYMLGIEHIIDDYVKKMMSEK